MSVMQANVGPQNNGDGTPSNLRAGKQGDLIVSELHGRFYEQAYRGNVFSAPLGLTAITNVTFTTATTGATATPILGLWNPYSSGVNAVILRAKLSLTLTALVATGGAPFIWMASAGNVAAPSTGARPWNTKSLSQSAGGVNQTGSQVWNMSGVALTGLTNALASMFGSSLSGGSPVNTSETFTVAGVPWQVGSTEDHDGDLIIPPGGILALMATTTPVAHSASGGLWFEEVPTTP